MLKSSFLQVSCFILLSCSDSNTQINPNEGNNPIVKNSTEETYISINPAGTTIESRFNVPKGYERIKNDKNSFGSFLQNLPLKKDGAVVHIYDGRIKENNGIYLGVVDLPIGNKDLHQCADAVMRLRAEYLFSQKKYGEISFLNASGNYLSYIKWLNGKLPDKGNLWSYLEDLFNVANTTSLNKQLISKPLEKLEIGDVFIFPWQNNRPGHAIIVVDKCVNSDGKVKFMLAQSFMPAQELQILNNPNYDGFPWYDLEFGKTLVTSEISFKKDQLKSFK